MVDLLLDTNVLVDMLRNHPPAIAWKNAQGKAIFGIPSIVGMEIIEGARDKNALNRSLRFLSQFQIIYANEDEQKWATVQLAKYKLSHNVDLTDALIAAPAHRLHLPLFTRNIKHFMPMIPSLVQKPY